MNDGQVTVCFPTTCNEKQGKETKTKDFSLAKEDSSPCKLRWLRPSEQEFHGA